MTVDKEMLIKHRFWISLGVFVLLWLVGVILIPTVQGSINADKEKKYLDSKKTVEGINDPKTEKFQEPLKAKEGELKTQKNKVWAEAYQPQADLMAWPEGGNARLSEKLSKAYFGDYISLNDRSEYGSKLYNQYLDSLGLVDMVAPVDFASGWKQVIKPVSKWDPDRPPTVEECWLAQEDLWVKRELLAIIQETLDSIRVFKPFTPEAKDGKEAKEAKDGKETAKDEPAAGKSQRMRNANWELNLILESNGTAISSKSTFKNINPWKRTLSLADVHFRIHQGGESSFDFTLPLDRVAGDETTDFKVSVPFKKFRPDPSKPLQVEELLTWQTSPIKRIERLELGYNSHRTANRACKAKQIGRPGEEDKKETPTTQTGAGGPGMGEMTGSRGGGPGTTTSPDAGGLKSGGSSGISSDLRRERYLDFSEQVRWMPVGIVLVIDQQYMQNVQVAVANSRLRIQPTQVAYHRAYGVRPPVTTSTTPAPDRRERTTGPTVGEGIVGGGRGGYGPTSPPPGGYGSTSSPAPPGAGSGKFSGTFPPPGGGSSGPSGPPSPKGGQSTSAATEDDPNLTELSIYGIASLYERFPAKAQAAAK